MSTLSSLPIELQYQLIKTCHQSGQDILAKLSQLDRFYHQLSKPLLNSEINLRSQDEDYNLNQLERFKFNFIPFHRLEIKSISFKFLNHCDFRIDENLAEILSLSGLIEKLEISYDFGNQIEENFLDTIESISKLSHLNTLIIKGPSDSSDSNSQHQYPQVSLILKNLTNFKKLQRICFQRVQILVLPDEFNFGFDQGSIDLEIIDCQFISSSNSSNLQDLQKLKTDQIYGLNSFLKTVSVSIKSLKLINLDFLQIHLNLLEFDLPNLLNLEIDFGKLESREEEELEKLQNQFKSICFQSLCLSHQLISLKINHQFDLNYLFEFQSFFQFQQILYS
ncbi:uncharacterized protein MELLADRAFT_115254 [Melampsora larici-populina 98AG31]|uniref:Uncharacterized protein n=1 Tax=Melampsora larici-populina (strain 98AG31 / pathotype 3-4-7) TaxID=747676 RepID=F4R894_MELLP|nr:uncharacterized protein MELLADRAFT_115254 [Melampsora larici-populina 98AG31]EGG11453.1 hypothetical protein MELLADRAFT_115254 [Melampsora larici-populina 98AG31]